MEQEETIKDIVGSTRKLVRSVYLDSWKMSKRSGLTGPQTLTLRCLAASGPLSSAELSRKLFVTPSNMTGLVDRLEKKELVIRAPKPGDRRVMLITLTETGGTLAATMPDPIERKLVAGLKGLGAGRVQDISQALHHILDLIDARESEDAPLDLAHTNVSEQSHSRGEDV